MSDSNPSNVDISAERAVLSSIMEHNISAFIKTEDIFLQSSDFFYSTNSSIYWAMKEFYGTNPNGRIDSYSIMSEIKKTGDKRTISMLEDGKLIESLSISKVSIDAVEGVAYSVKKNAVFRAIVDGIKEMGDDVEDAICPALSLEDLLVLVENKYSSLSESISNPNAKFETFGDVAEEWLEEIIENPQDYAGIPTGFPIYDQAIGRGLRRGTINMVGARTGIGKSLLSLNFGNSISNIKIPTLYLDTEMMKEAQLSRLAAHRAGIDIDEIETGRFTKDPSKLIKVRKKIKELTKLPFYHEYVGGWRFEEILSYMKKWVRQCVGENEDGSTKDCVIIFDYLKMMRTDGLASMKEYQLIGFWMTALHDFSVRYDLPIFMLIQLNRDGINNEGQGVAAQSDRTEWIAASVTILKNKSKDEMVESAHHGNAKLIVVKSRFGPTTAGGDWINIFANKSKATLIEGQLQSMARRDDESKANSDKEKEHAKA